MDEGRPLTASATLADVAFAVSGALRRLGENVVLCGGSAATYYAPQAYQSRDLDFVITFGASPAKVRGALEPLGYIRQPEGLYAHADVPYTIDFLPGPVAIGEETITVFHRARRGAEELHVLTVTDVVKDRVMHFWAWQDWRALRIAALVASACEDRFDRAAFEAWAHRQAASPGYDPARLEAILGQIIPSR